MKYEWDENKNRLNIEKHFIDFNDAKEIFNDGCRLEYMVHKNNEDRVVVIGKVNDVVIVVVYTMRHKNIRLISARMARRIERKEYKERRK
tara:strand:- start:581 stop:850 length:270 start_codon:yes stop_codon:yes gene_type:complete